tara:strand:+ start:43 stop:984 length:942 start_codon:yes stop_codon:yes gene_type:complete
MNKSIVLNICGVKSLGGLKLIHAALNVFKNSEYKIILLHDNNLNENIDINSYEEVIETSFNRFLHPFLNIFLSKNDMDTINKSEAVIHFGNFGFKTKNKSFTLIQNLLPLKLNNPKNLILMYFIEKSFKKSDHIIYQLDHVAGEIKNKFKSKLIKIGVVEKFTNNINSETGLICINSKIKNKNFNFMEAVLEEVEIEMPELKITNFYSEEKQKIEGGNSTSLLDSFSKHSIYFHTSFYETVGLPLYEASSAGLLVVAPGYVYMDHFDTSNSIKYTPNDIESATRSIKKAVNFQNNTIESLKYTEDWGLVLKSI